MARSRHERPRKVKHVGMGVNLARRPGGGAHKPKGRLNERGPAKRAAIREGM